MKRLAIIALLLLTASARADEALYVEANGLTRSGWAFEELQGAGGDEGVRKDSWSAHPGHSPEWRATTDDYAGSGWDTGHAAPSNDFTTQFGKDQTFTLANASPQDRSVNRGVWKRIENEVRSYRADGVSLSIATGPLYVPGDDGVIHVRTIGRHRVWVPTHHAKAVLIEKGDERQAIAWKVPNGFPRGPLPSKQFDAKAFRVSVDEIEFDAGRDLFKWLPESEQKRLEAAK